MSEIKCLPLQADVPVGSVTVSSYIVEVPPHRRAALFRYPSNFTYPPVVLEIPLPWTYYRIERYSSFRARDGIHGPATRVGGIWCRPEPVTNWSFPNDFNCLPLPNTGRRGYTCSRPHMLVASFDQGDESRALFSVENFWEECFKYMEEWSEAHTRLYEAAGCHNITDSYALEPYRYWESLSLEQIATQPWLNVLTASMSLREGSPLHYHWFEPEPSQ